MADGNFGKRDINLDIAGVTTARVIRDATKGEWVKITAIEVTGTAPATGTQGAIILREESASGNIIFTITPGNNEVVRYSQSYSDCPVVKGLYMDAMTAGWAAGVMMIHTK